MCDGNSNRSMSMVYIEVNGYSFRSLWLKCGKACVFIYLPGVRSMYTRDTTNLDSHDSRAKGLSGLITTMLETWIFNAVLETDLSSEQDCCAIQH